MNEASKKPTPSSTSSMLPRKKRTNIDFSKLSWGTLRKYQYYFRVKTDSQPDGREDHTRDAVESAVTTHFEDLKIDYGKLTLKFLKIKKDEKNDQLNNLRKSQRARQSAAMGAETMFANYLA